MSAPEKKQTCAKKEGRPAPLVHDDSTIRCVDFFCGVGGLSYGLQQAGINVIAGIDLDASCQYPYEANNGGKFIAGDIAKLNPSMVSNLLAGAHYTMLAGCAPCQPFSSYSHAAKPSKDWVLLYAFGRLVKECKPDFVTMENVPGIAKHKVYIDFLQTLRSEGYNIAVNEALFCPDYGIPQRRKRLVLLASRIGAISFPKATHDKSNFITVRDAIGQLQQLGASQFSSDDPLHIAAGLTPLNLKRIRASKPGGTWRDWPKSLVAECHRKDSGITYPSVYGRMSWEFPSPTITTQFYGFGNGRFGHPEQDRAISLREGAILQTFPIDYRFLKPGEAVQFVRLGKLIGNAVPVKLGEVAGQAIIEHARSVPKQQHKVANG